MYECISTKLSNWEQIMAVVLSRNVKDIIKSVQIFCFIQELNH